jgi:hypothetical protein
MAARLGEQVIDGERLRMVAQHLERVALRGQVLLRLQHLRQRSARTGPLAALSQHGPCFLPLLCASVTASTAFPMDSSCGTACHACILAMHRNMHLRATSEAHRAPSLSVRVRPEAAAPPWAACTAR